jgi:hypothetical protein
VSSTEWGNSGRSSGKGRSANRDASAMLGEVVWVADPVTASACGAAAAAALGSRSP